MNDWAILFLVYAAVFISSPLISIFHELGHALAYLIFTKPDRIDIYIGSYGSDKKYLQFKAGKLHFYIKRLFPFVKGIGLCRSYKQEPNYLNHIVILLAGPVFTLFAAAVFAIPVLNPETNLYYKIVSYIFLSLSLLSLLVNLIPSDVNDSPFGLTNKKDGLANDGKQILFNLSIKRSRPSFIEALDFMENDEYELANEKLKDVLKVAPRSQKILRLIIQNSARAKKNDEALFYTGELESKFELSANDLFIKGYLHSLMSNHDEAITAYSKSIRKDKSNAMALNNIGSELIEKGAHEVAKRALERAIKLNPKFDLPYINLGFSKILLGDLETAKTLLDKSLELNPKGAEVYKVIGIYYLKLGDDRLALLNHDKAIELDPDIDFGAYADDLKTLLEQKQVPQTI